MTTLIAGNGTGSKRARGSTTGALSPSRVLGAVVALQRDRWILWLPVAMIAGAALWLAAPTDPQWWLGPALLVVGLGAAFAFAAWPGASPDGPAATLRHAVGGACAMLAAVGLGIGAAHVRGLTVADAPYAGGDEPVRVEGWVVANEASDNGPRLRLLVRDIEGVTAPPRYVRVSVSQAGLLTAGRAATCRAVLGPPSGPMAPGAYDFARRAYFERLGGTGFAFGRCRPAAFDPPSSWLDRQRLLLAAMRADLSAAIVEAAPGRGGAIAAALISGDRSAVDRDTNEMLFNAGLGHLLSVSGIHMSIVGGLVFAFLLWTLSLVSPIALRFPVKKLAAAGALVAVGAYLIVSGINVPALRSFVMACVAFGAILIDRPAISMRGLAVAAFVVALIFPESVLEPGFQMSFAATMALVALFEMLKRAPHEPALPTPGPLIGALNASARGLGGVLIISFVAGLATDPFAIYHFQRFSVYSLPANLIAAPLMSFLVAPAACAAAVLAPFGLADPALEVMASALDLIAAVGQTFGERPEAVRALPRPPDLAFALCVLALLWACLWRGALRWAAAPIFIASIALYVIAPRPLVALDGDLRAIYARDSRADRWLLIAAGGRSTFARDRLGAMLGMATPEVERLAPPETCGEAVCTWQSGGHDFRLVRTEQGLETACASGAVVISGVPTPPGYAELCELSRLIDANDLARLGGAIIYDSGASVRVERAWSTELNRPWTMRGEADQE